MSNDKFHLHPDLHDASLEKACKMANDLIEEIEDASNDGPSHPGVTAFNLSYMLEYLRLNFDLVPKK